MLPMTPELQKVFDRGARALEAAFRPEHSIHLAIDWQRLYCDPNIPTNAHGNLQQATKITATLGRVNDFADAARIVTPTWWVYHDPEINKDSFPHDYFLGVNEHTVARKIAHFREEGLAICGHVDHERDIVLRKPFKNAFAGTDLHERLERREIDTLLVSGLYRFYRECVGLTVTEAAGLGYKTFVVEDLTVDKVDHTDRSRLALAQMTERDGAYCVTSDQVRRVLSKFQP